VPLTKPKPKKKRPATAARLIDRLSLELLSYGDLMKLTGKSLTTLQRAVREGRLPAYKLGRSVRFREKDVKAFFDAELQPWTSSSPGSAGTP